MDKRTFFDNLHRKLAEKYSTAPSSIQFIRDFSIGKNKTREQMIDWLEERIKNSYILMDTTKFPNYKLTLKKQIQQKNLLIEFLESLTQEQMTDITQSTEFDKNK